MPKFIKKQDVKFIDGYMVTTNGDVVAPAKSIMRMFHDLEYEVQRKMFNDDHAPVMVALEKFKPRSCYDAVEPHVFVSTPTMDADVKHSLDVMAEKEKLAAANKYKKIRMFCDELVKFAEQDMFLADSAADPDDARWDLMEIGNPLVVSKDDLDKYFRMLADFEQENDPDCEACMGCYK